MSYGAGKNGFDLYVGSDNLNSLAGIVLRSLGRVRKVAFYVIDFTPARFPGRLMNAIYQAINKICCYHADVIWNVSPAMAKGRERIGIRASLSALQITVPLGCDFKKIQMSGRGAGDPAQLSISAHSVRNTARAYPGGSTRNPSENPRCQCGFHRRWRAQKVLENRAH